jgi:general L-amino acid transport system permease protein
MTAVSTTRTRPPLWRDVRVLRVLAQAGVLVGVVLVLSWLFDNLFTNLERQGIDTGFGYLDQPAGVTIPGSEFRSTQSRLDAVWVGLGNTIRVSAAGIAMATVLGVLLGIARLSTNWLVRTGARLYVELVRNVPLLVIIIFTYLVVVLQLPPVEEAMELAGVVVLSNRGGNVAWFLTPDGVLPALAVPVVALAVALLVRRWRLRRFDATGEPTHPALWATAAFVVAVVAASTVLGGPIDPTAPVRDGRRVDGGIRMSPEFFALLLSLVIYTASHIAEITRGSIQAVPRGQIEAASAVALSGFQRMRFVVLPQAARIAIPPLANQYLNLTKNSSLALFIGYFDLTRVTQQAIANGNPAPQLILILMGCYLFLSLTISFFANIVNRSLALESR